MRVSKSLVRRKSPVSKHESTLGLIAHDKMIRLSRDERRNGATHLICERERESASIRLWYDVIAVEYTVKYVYYRTTDRSMPVDVSVSLLNRLQGVDTLVDVRYEMS